MKKNSLIIFLSVLIFGGLGFYLTFIYGDTDKYDSKTAAYKIEVNEHYDSIDNNYTYNPIYYFKIGDEEHECVTKNGSSSYPKESKNMVYYDSKNPENCKTEYEVSSSKFAGIICLIVAAVILYFFVFKKPDENSNEYGQQQEGQQNEMPIDQEKVEKVVNTIEKVSLIYKRVILGAVILVLLIFLLVDFAIIKQTIKAKDYIDTTATFVIRNESENDNVFDDCIYTFIDKNGIQQDITISMSKDDIPEETIKIKYDANNPKEFYEENATMDKSGMIWFAVKLVILIGALVLFFNKKLLSKIHLSVR